MASNTFFSQVVRIQSDRGHAGQNHGQRRRASENTNDTTEKNTVH